MASIKPPSLPIDDPSRRRLPILLRRAWFSLNQSFRRLIAHTGVTPDQFTAMRTIVENEPAPLRQSDLTRIMNSDPNTIASLLERMETAAWISRAPDLRDRRAHCITLLPAGRRKYKQVRRIAIKLQSEVLAAWPPDRREAFLQDLESLADRARSAGSGSE